MRALALLALLLAPISAWAQGGIGPGPGTVHSTGGGGGGSWTLVAHTILTPVANTGGTTSAIDCTGANLIVVMAAHYYQGGIDVVLADSSSNTYTRPSGTGGSGGSGSRSRVDTYYKISPTVTSSMTFTLSGGLGGVSYGRISVECWQDTAGTPTYQGWNWNVGDSISSLAAMFSPLTSASSGYLAIAGVATQDASSGTLSINSGFISPFLDALDSISSISIQEGMTYFLPSSSGVLNPTITFGATITDAATSMIQFSP